MGLQVCEQPRAFLCSQAEQGAWGPSRSKGRVPLAWRSCCKEWLSNSLAFHLRGFMCVSAPLQDIWTHRPVQTDRYRHRCTHTLTKCKLHFLQYLNGDNKLIFVLYSSPTPCVWVCISVLMYEKLMKIMKVRKTVHERDILDFNKIKL